MELVSAGGCENRMLTHLDRALATHPNKSALHDAIVKHSVCCAVRQARASRCIRRTRHTEQVSVTSFSHAATAGWCRVSLVARDCSDTGFLCLLFAPVPGSARSMRGVVSAGATGVLADAAADKLCTAAWAAACICLAFTRSKRALPSGCRLLAAPTRVCVRGCTREVEAVRCGTVRCSRRRRAEERGDIIPGRQCYTLYQPATRNPATGKLQQ